MATKSLRTLASEFTRARDGYAVSRSAANRKRLTRSMLAYLKAGGRIGFGVAVEEKTA